LETAGSAQACTRITLPVHLQERDYLVYETVNMFSGYGFCPVPVLFLHSDYRLYFLGAGNFPNNLLSDVPQNVLSPGPSTM